MKSRHLLIAATVALAAHAEAQIRPEVRPASGPEPVTVIHAGMLLAEPGKPARARSSVIIRGHRISEVRDGYVNISGARVVDLEDSYVLPGLIDMHVHLQGNKGSLQERLNANFQDHEDDAFRMLENAKATLLAGFTTVRDLSGEPRTITSLRDAIAEDRLIGPTVISAARMVSVTGGHSDLTNGVNRDLHDALAPGVARHVCDGSDDCRRAVRAQVSAGADVIKVAVTGGVYSNVAGGLGLQMMSDELKSVVETAHSFGRKVAAHAHGVHGVNAALEAGVDSVEHGTFTDDRSFALYRKTGAFYVPTLMPFTESVAQAERGLLTTAQAQKAREAFLNAGKSFARAVREGVRIAFGTDAGVFAHGRNAEEFALLVDGGMTPEAAIRSATVNAAELLGRSDRIGRIEAGRDADIIAVPGDPTRDVRLLQTVSFVMRHGRVHKLAGQRQLTEVD